MKLESTGLLIDMRPLNERDAIARIFTADYGVLCGVMRAALVMKKNRPLVGQMGAVAWNARLDTQLGAFHWDASRNLAAPLMGDARRLMLMNAAFGLIGTLLPEREPYGDLYGETWAMLTQLAGQGTAADETYLNWEIALVRDLGYALDLSACSGCGGAQDLCYLSPRTGRAVCRTCGAPYASRLYHLPLSLDITGRFLDAICIAQGTQIPRSRQIIIA